MKHATKCKFCRVSIILEIDDDYSELGDPFKLLKFAACDKCADLRVKRRGYEDGIGAQCSVLIQGTKEQRSKVRDRLEDLTRKYAFVIAEIYGNSTAIWDMAFVELLMDKPHKWGQVLTGYVGGCRK